MALIDVKKYFFSMQRQYLELKATLADFEQAFKDGYITEDRLVEAIDDVNKVEQNYTRLAYIMHLIDSPRKKERKVKHNKANSKLTKYFADNRARDVDVELENKDALAHLRSELKRITANTGNSSN